MRAGAGCAEVGAEMQSGEGDCLMKEDGPAASACKTGCTCRRGLGLVVSN